MTDRPVKFPTWAQDDIVDPVSGSNNVIEPPEAKKLQGFGRAEKVPRQWFNYQWRLTYLWLMYLDEQSSALQDDVEQLKTDVINLDYRVKSLEILPKAPIFAMSALPSASEEGKGSYIYVEEVDGGSLVFSDGQHWRKVSDRNIVS